MRRLVWLYATGYPRPPRSLAPEWAALVAPRWALDYARRIGSVT